MSKKTKLKELLTSMNNAPTGGFVGITDYHSERGDIVSLTGRLGTSYIKAREIALANLKEAIKSKDFEVITVKGQCYEENGIYNVRKRSWDIKEYSVTYNVAMVLQYAKEILEAWENPKERKNNKVQLSDKENGLSFNTETGSFNFSLMVEHETYKTSKDKDEKVKAQAPETKLKDVIRKRFEKKIKSYTIAEGKFAKLTIGGKQFLSENITF